ncbi:MAG: tetratricopeptide repeat protein [Prolixibacteraceae bacterium]|nr:tetratricopeptide repeat protein [Prolixibacteraceae bacterium]
MKKLLATFILVIAFLAMKAEPSDSLQKANEYYVDNEFAKAVEMYENILDKGYESAALYFNLGNAHYKNGNLTSAILNYERAKLLAPNDEDIQFNLDLANQFVVDKIEPLPRPFFLKWWHNLINMNTTNGWALISIAAFIFTLVFAAVYVFSRSTGLKKLGFAIAVIFLIGSLVTFGFSGVQKMKIIHRDHAIILSPTVTVKASPAESGTPLFVIHEGLKVEITEELGNWYEIKLADGNTGWLEKSTLEKI